MSTESMTRTGAAVPQAAADGVTNPKGIGLFRMVTTVITLIVGAGVFSLSGEAAAGGASGWAILTAWGISAIGVFCLVMTFFALSRVKPDLKGGIYTYAATGFGDFLGFSSAWGYWISALLCTVSFSALLFGALSYFFPIFGNGTNLYAVIGASCIIWFYAFLVSRGISEVTLINAVITISKFVPLLIGIIAIIFIGAFKPDIFIANLTTGADPSLAFVDQVQTAMMVTIWVFIGIEGAVAISGRAKKAKDVGKATIIAFICVLTLYLTVSILSMGVMPLSELANLENPALAYVMQAAVGDWGAVLINFAVSLSLIGAMLGYTVLASESPFEAAEEGVFIKAFAKTNKKGAPVVKLSANFGIQSATYVPDVVTDPIQYMNMRNQAELNEGKLTVTYNRDDILEYEEGMKHDKYIYPASDWYDLCYQNGFLQQYNARVSGGTDKISYSLGGGYMNQRGIMVANDDAERFSWDMKINAQVTKRLKVGISLLGNLRYNTDPIYGVSTTVNVINRALPIFGTQLPDGKWLSTWLSTPGRNNPENPLMELHEGNTKRQLHRILGRINIGYDLPWGIKYNANLGYVKVDHYSKDFKHAMYTYNPKTLERKNFSAYVSAKDWDNNAINYTFYNTLSWGKSFGGNHNFNVMVGTEYKRYDGKNFQAKKRDYFNNQLTALSVGSTMEDISGGSSLELLFSYFGRITYDYKEKYLIDVTARYDGSSKFAKGNRWAFFPAVSVGWRIDKENFMQNVRAVDVLKLRGSVGEMGNQAIGNYEYLMAVLANKSYNYSFGDVLSGGAAIKDFVDENISWETTRTYNLGLDFEAFDHRLLFSVDLYKKRTEGILRDVKIPAQIGNLNGPKQNIGVEANDGVELNLQWRSAVKNFHYSLGGNFCYNKNIVVDLDGQEYIKTFNIIREGEPIDAWYLYQADGFYNSYEEIANSVTVGSGVKPGEHRR